MQNSAVKVLLLQDTTNYAGTEAHVLTLAKNLEEHTDVSPIVGVTAGGELEMRCAAGNIPYRVLQKTPGVFNLAGIMAVAKMLHNREVDLLHAHNGRTSLVAVCAKLITRKGRVVLTQHFIEPDYVNRKGISGKLASEIHRFILRNVDQHICISDVVKTAFVERQARGFLDQGTMHIVHNGVDNVSAKLDRNTCRENLLSYLKLPAMTKLIVCVSRLEPEKDVKALLTSLACIEKVLPFHCVIVGDGSERVQLETYVSNANIADRVCFTGYRDDIPAIMRAADVFVLPSPAEGFGLVVVEAMMAALPVVAINNGGPVEIVVPEQTGILVPRDDVNSMANAVTKLLENPTICQSMGFHGQQRAMAVYSSATMAISTSNVYALCAS
jgi:glycosyltransferase involved in cell wall biosynthesis